MNKNRCHDNVEDSKHFKLLQTIFKHIIFTAIIPKLLSRLQLEDKWCPLIWHLVNSQKINLTIFWPNFKGQNDNFVFPNRMIKKLNKKWNYNFPPTHLSVKSDLFSHFTYHWQIRLMQFEVKWTLMFLISIINKNKQ